MVLHTLSYLFEDFIFFHVTQTHCARWSANYEINSNVAHDKHTISIIVWEKGRNVTKLEI